MPLTETTCLQTPDRLEFGVKRRLEPGDVRHSGRVRIRVVPSVRTASYGARDARLERRLEGASPVPAEDGENSRRTIDPDRTGAGRAVERRSAETEVPAAGAYEGAAGGRGRGGEEIHLNATAQQLRQHHMARGDTLPACS